MLPMIRRYCITHEKPLLPESWYDECIALGGFRPDSALHVRNLDSFWHEARPVAFGAAGSYVLPIALEKVPGDVELVEISSYRKRILPFPEGTESVRYPTLRQLNCDRVEREAELATFTPRNGLTFLVSQPLYFKKSVKSHYATIHHRRDILDYTAIAVEMGVLDADSAAEFLAAKHFIPGGVELGIFPKRWLVQTLSAIEVVGRQFVQRYANRLRRYNTYQIRAVGFLSERLGSFFLIRQLMAEYSNNIPAEIFGHMTVMVEGKSGYSAGLAERPGGRSGRYQLTHRRAR
ncbi:hypothetical protein [Mycolicibacterium holsaticum]|jgi:hypothetical protein|uniref:Uncharacterized protein n=1 Tax=Mycolicibacterium holsaticum TaxID=152142 RepID=A0A1E3S0N9_9MYCO|nr:hypothetical protein [Mycolicibacterium holsaticum]ODQ95678.1 hypothetical protein BHQ17_04035 [Mycolicibacterium holsaticum]